MNIKNGHNETKRFNFSIAHSYNFTTISWMMTLLLLNLFSNYLKKLLAFILINLYQLFIKEKI
jgi:hypothetical protein